LVLEIISEFTRNLVPVIMIMSLVLFARLALKVRSLSSLQAELAIFAIIFIAAELPRSLIALRVITVSPETSLLGLLAHTTSMIAFGVLIVWRFNKIRVRGKS
jgi:hypothetical protein